MRVELDRQARARDWPIDKKNPLWERAKTYKRQYVGIRRKKPRIIYANFFCDASGTKSAVHDEAPSPIDRAPNAMSLRATGAGPAQDPPGMLSAGSMHSR